MRPLVVLFTDFGTTDPFVGTMKGVVLSSCPDATLVDLTHDVPPQAVHEGAFLLERSFRFFPEGSVFVAVVDPGVGTERRGIVVRAHGRTFVGPDNGLIASVASLDAGARVHVIDGQRLGLPEPSRTFHGRDVFAPVAARLASGALRVEDVGPAVEHLEPALHPVAVSQPDRVEGSIVTVDRFGNLISNVEGSLARAIPGATVEIGALVLPLSLTYADVPPGAPLALVDAYDVVEVAVRNGHAARELGLGRGFPIVVRVSEPRAS